MSTISWTDITCNPIHLVRPDGSHGGHWCQKVSPGCTNCYSETQNQSNYFKFASKLRFTGEVPENLIFDEEVMKKLIGMRSKAGRKPSKKKVFLCSMTDLFGEWVKEEWIDLAFAYMAIANQHTFQILTKRAERMAKYFKSGARQRIRIAVVDLGRQLNLKPETYEPYETFDFEWPLANVWLGTSVENQKAADDRIPWLIKTPAAVRFLSCEPLLQKVILKAEYSQNLNWVIIGGESGSGARPCHLDWIQSIVQQCATANLAVFVKQLGSNPVDNNYVIKPKDRKGGEISEFPEDLQIRQFP
ncbi:DUF5131 family protein [Microcoleus sp. A006_D1]|uniref:DUF5131 family protein n=1 Tax=Microcoleus sp. A006_D1 TaxID=3055267 RepID=UPI002FD7962A